jgi:hypothetical protein
MVDATLSNNRCQCNFNGQPVLSSSNQNIKQTVLYCLCCLSMTGGGGLNVAHDDETVNSTLTFDNVTLIGNSAA